nr:dual specificity testis-specific protein kinase 1-like [Procambarus clarkii]
MRWVAARQQPPQQHGPAARLWMAFWRLAVAAMGHLAKPQHHLAKLVLQAIVALAVLALAVRWWRRRRERCELLGAGAHAKVFACRMSQCPEEQALCFKVFNCATEEEVRQEYDALRALEAVPGVPRAVALNTQPLGIVMTRHCGTTLRQVLEKGRLSYPQALEVMLQVCTTLARVHEQGYVHNDVHPKNISVELAGGVIEVVVLDFGLATVIGGRPDTFRKHVTDDPAEHDRNETRRRALYPWFAPEVFHGGAATPAADVYSFAYTCFITLTYATGVANTRRGPLWRPLWWPLGRRARPGGSAWRRANPRPSCSTQQHVDGPLGKLIAQAYSFQAQDRPPLTEMEHWLSWALNPPSSTPHLPSWALYLPSWALYPPSWALHPLSSTLHPPTWSLDPPFFSTFVQESGPVVQESGPAVQESGPAVQESGPAVQESGPAVQKSGPAVQESGPVVQESGPAVQESGRAVQESGRAVQESGPTVEDSKPITINVSGPITIHVSGPITIQMSGPQPEAFGP